MAARSPCAVVLSDGHPLHSSPGVSSGSPNPSRAGNPIAAVVSRGCRRTVEVEVESKGGAE